MLLLFILAAALPILISVASSTVFEDIYLPECRTVNEPTQISIHSPLPPETRVYIKVQFVFVTMNIFKKSQYPPHQPLPSLLIMQITFWLIKRSFLVIWLSGVLAWEVWWSRAAGVDTSAVISLPKIRKFLLIQQLHRAPLFASESTGSAFCCTVTQSHCYVYQRTLGLEEVLG